MAFKADMRKIMVTCFKHNPAAQKFFKGALKYEIDETSQTDDVYEQFDYEVCIFSIIWRIRHWPSENLMITVYTSYCPTILSKLLDIIKIQQAKVDEGKDRGDGI